MAVVAKQKTEKQQPSKTSVIIVLDLDYIFYILNYALLIKITLLRMVNVQQQQQARNLILSSSRCIQAQVQQVTVRTFVRFYLKRGECGY